MGYSARPIATRKRASAIKKNAVPPPYNVVRMAAWLKTAVTSLALLAAAGGGVYYWIHGDASGAPPGLVSGNGRVEATEINVAAKIPARVEEMFADEGDFVTAGQPLVRMRTDTLEAQRAEAQAQLDEARQAVASARSRQAMRQADLAAAQAMIAQRESELAYARRRLARYEQAGEKAATSVQEVDEERTRTLVAQAALTAATAVATAAQSAIDAASAEIALAESTVVAREATVQRIEADIRDSVLSSPRDGRVQYRIAQPGEVLPAGGRAMNVIDLGDVYMTFFLPERAAGKVALGTEVRLVLDAAPEYVIPAQVSFVASVAQFTPKTVETADERQKLMFRVRARIDPGLMRKHLARVKTGLPGVAWVRIDPDAPWPENLTIKVPE
jgi:HlyD family secretion protein